MATIFRKRKGELLMNHKYVAGVPVPDCRPALTRELFGPEIEVCSFCAEPHATGWWRGHQDVKACTTCAVEVLPRLMADALIGEFPPGPSCISNLYRAVETILKNLWQAVAVAIFRVGQVKDRDAERKPRARQLAQGSNGLAPNELN